MSKGKRTRRKSQEGGGGPKRTTTRIWLNYGKLERRTVTPLAVCERKADSASYVNRRFANEGEEPMLGEKPSRLTDRDLMLVRMAKEYAGKANWCLETTVCGLCFCISMRAALAIFGVFALVFFVAPLDPWGISDHWNADDQYKYGGVKDTDYP